MCGYSPYQEVQCSVRAFNEAGDSQIASSLKVRTDCARKLSVCSVGKVIFNNLFSTNSYNELDR